MNQRSEQSPGPVALCLILAVVAGTAKPASAQSDEGGGNASELQRTVFITVGNACPALAPTSTRDGPTEEDFLFTRCNDILATLGQNGTEGDLSAQGVDQDDVLESLLEIGHRQLPAASKNTTEATSIHTAAVTQRLYALRQGATGIMIAGNLRDREGNRLPIDLNLLQEDSAAGPITLPAGMGVYLNGAGSRGHRNGQGDELAYDVRGGGFTLGADYRLNDAIVAGGAFTYTRANQDIEADRGGVESNAYALSGYGAFRGPNYYFDGIATYSRNDMNLERRIVYFQGTTGAVDETARSNPKGDEFSIGFGAGYELQRGSVTYGPTIRTNWIWLDINSFEESGASGLNLTYAHDDVASGTLDLGFEVSDAYSTRFGVIVPQVGIAWSHQFRDDSRPLSAVYTVDPTTTAFELVTEKPDRNYMNFDVAISMSFKAGWSGFVSYRSIFEHNRMHANTVNFGGRYSF
jgi:outer membrane lipase/esterase